MYIRFSHKFTMMELISVMVIVILLITIVLPVYVKSRECAKDLKCKSNLKGLAGAVQSYVNDNKGFAPMRYNYGCPWTAMLIDAGYIGAVRVNRLASYDYPNGTLYKNVLINDTANWGGPSNPACQYPISYDNILACPSETINSMYNAAVASQLGYSGYNKTYRWVYRTHYGMQRRIIDTCWSHPITWWNTKLTSNVMARMPMIGDGSTGNAEFYGGGVYSHLYWARHWGRSVNISTTSISTNALGAFGNARANMIMLDGHIRAVNEVDVFRENLWNVFSH